MRRPQPSAPIQALRHEVASYVSCRTFSARANQRQRTWSCLKSREGTNIIHNNCRALDHMSAYIFHPPLARHIRQQQRYRRQATGTQKQNHQMTINKYRHVAITQDTTTDLRTINNVINMTLKGTGNPTHCIQRAHTASLDKRPLGGPISPCHDGASSRQGGE